MATSPHWAGPAGFRAAVHAVGRTGRANPTRPARRQAAGAGARPPSSPGRCIRLTRSAARPVSASKLQLTEMMRRANVTAGGIPPVAITGITADSRAVAPGFLFAALPGASIDGRRFIADAVERGAGRRARPARHRMGRQACRPRPADPGRRAAPARWPAWPLPRPARSRTPWSPSPAPTARPARRSFCASSWPAASHPPASARSGVIAPGSPRRWRPDHPRPGDPGAKPWPPWRAKACGFAALEASSHGLDQFRLDGVRLAAGRLHQPDPATISDYHGDMAAYRAAKLRLFTDLLPPGSPAVATTALDAHSTEALRAAAAARRLKLGFVGEDGDLIRLLRAVPASWRPIARRAGRRRAPHHRPGAAGPLPGGTTPCSPPPLAQAVGESSALDRLATLTGVRGRMELAATLPNGAAVYVGLRPHAGRAGAAAGRLAPAHRRAPASGVRRRW